MKKHLLFAISFVAFSFQVFAQNNIQLKINHKLQFEDFAFDQAAKNNMDHDFKIDRLEYYISEISIIHDGGNETLIENRWILADASTKTEVDLGEFDITNVEKIKLHIGVDEAHNHLDPSGYPSTHPLSPKFPSMHWGWTAGYRFVALEGYGGTDLNQLIQLHGLGDENYFTAEIDLEATAVDNLISINLDADYTKALQDISVNSGIVVHGDNLEAKQCLENFRDFVFTQEGTISSNNDIDEIKEFGLFPNPVSFGNSTIKLNTLNSSKSFDICINSAEGKQMGYHASITNGQSIDFTNYAAGIYFINLISEGQTVKVDKIIVQ